MILSNEEKERINRYFNAANYLSVGQLYLKDNPLLKRPLKKDDLKKKVVGHWGTVPTQNFIYAHLNRVIKKYDLNMIYISGPGHGGNAIVSNVYLEGTYSEIYPNISQDEEGLKKLFKQFSFPKGISSHVAPETPGSINEGGELGYSLVHGFGAVLDNKDLIATVVVGDGEAETGPLATSWHCNKLLNPKTDGVVLPILNLNGYKIANPTILARISKEELLSLFKGYGYDPIYIERKDPSLLHEEMAKALDSTIIKIKKIKEANTNQRPLWPMIILKTPKGWTGPKTYDGKTIEGSFRSHQVPLPVDQDHMEHVDLLEKWLKSYHPEDIFNSDGSLKEDLKALAPTGIRRMGANPYANGGLLLKELHLPDFRNYKVEVTKHGTTKAQDTKVLGYYLEDVMKKNHNFRIFGPDEALSNRLNAIFDYTNRQFTGQILDTDEYLAPTGQVIDSFLSEHICEGLLEGYILTGRHGIFDTYEAFVRIVDSMTSQHAKWLKVCQQLDWRRKISSLNYLLTSHIWQQDHNGYTHQDPGFLNHIATKKADIARIYLPPDANCLLSTIDHCIKSKNYINVVVASKHPSMQWLSMEEAVNHCSKGIGIFNWASNDQKEGPDIIMACCGDTPTVETLAAISILHNYFKQIKIRCVNVVDLMKLQSNYEHPHGLSNQDYNMLFTKDKPVIFAFHGYPSLIHQLTYKRENKNIHVHGYIEEGTITTPFDMRVQNKIDRYHLVMDALKYLDFLEDKRTPLYEWCKDQLIKHSEYIKEYGEDLDEIKNWTWHDINDEIEVL